MGADCILLIVAAFIPPLPRGGEGRGEGAVARMRELEALAHRELVTILGLQGRPRLLRITRWPQAIPQYALGHTAKQERIEAALAGWPGLFLVGNYFGGVAVGDVVRHTLEAARRVRGFLAQVDSAAGVLPG